MESSASKEVFDVVVVGAGIAGIGAAYHLSIQTPKLNFLVLESKKSFGGTWDTFRYPGIRCDSDMYTYSFKFKPWTGPPIAQGAEILKYLGDTIEENRLGVFFRYCHQIVRASWSSVDGIWKLKVNRLDTGEVLEVSTRFLWMCSGFYRHDVGYTPRWPSVDKFHGSIVHPQVWPENLDVSGKRVLVIGSGATAAGLVPSLVGRCEHVTMLQRSPSYFLSRPNSHFLIDTLKELDVSPKVLHDIVRRKMILERKKLHDRAEANPEHFKAELVASVRMRVGDEIDVDRHFTPRYKPFQQHLLNLVNGDLLTEIRNKRVTIVTEEIESFSQSGVKLKCGAALEADVIVTATGFQTFVVGDFPFDIDGCSVDFGKSVYWHGGMFSSVPNLVWIFGYIKSSFTLRVDLVADFMCRLLNHMRNLGVNVVTPTLRSKDSDMKLRPFLEEDTYNPGHLTRISEKLPKQGDRLPWLNPYEFDSDIVDLPKADLDDGSLIFQKILN